MSNVVKHQPKLFPGLRTLGQSRLAFKRLRSPPISLSTVKNYRVSKRLQKPYNTSPKITQSGAVALRNETKNSATSLPYQRACGKADDGNNPQIKSLPLITIVSTYLKNTH